MPIFDRIASKIFAFKNESMKRHFPELPLSHFWSSMNLAERTDIDDAWVEKNVRQKNFGCVSCDIFRVRLGGLKVILPLPDGREIAFGIDQSPVFRFLRGEEELYRHYCEYKNKLYASYGNHGGDVHTVEYTEELFAKMDAEGYQRKSTIVINQYNHIFDGQHRASYLLHKFGSGFKVKALRIWLK